VVSLPRNFAFVPVMKEGESVLTPIDPAVPSPYCLPESTGRTSVENRERALRLEVRVHAPKPSPYGWEIYDGDDAEAQPIKCSQGTYRTEEAARTAGNTTLMRMTKEDHAPADLGAKSTLPT
jgi:hypothetical protein